MRKIHIPFLVLLMMIAMPQMLDAQCSMCRLMAESSYQSGSEIGRGLNGGIMYIMGIPYVLLLVGGFILFKKNFTR